MIVFEDEDDVDEAFAEAESAAGEELATDGDCENHRVRRAQLGHGRRPRRRRRSGGSATSTTAAMPGWPGPMRTPPGPRSPAGPTTGTPRSTSGGPIWSTARPPRTPRTSRTRPRPAVDPRPHRPPRLLCPGRASSPGNGVGAVLRRPRGRPASSTTSTRTPRGRRPSTSPCSPRPGWTGTQGERERVSVRGDPDRRERDDGPGVLRAPARRRRVHGVDQPAPRRSSPRPPSPRVPPWPSSGTGGRPPGPPEGRPARAQSSRSGWRGHDLVVERLEAEPAGEVAADLVAR